MKKAVSVDRAVVGETKVLLGRPSATRKEWESAREADAADLNRFLAAGGDVEAYVVPLWSNGDIDRCLTELRGFDDARVYLQAVEGEGKDAVLAALAESEWAGAAYLGDDASLVAELLYSAGGLEIPIYVEHPQALNALALALGEDFSPREIEAVLRGEGVAAPDDDALDHAKELLEG